MIDGLFCYQHGKRFPESTQTWFIVNYWQLATAGRLLDMADIHQAQKKQESMGDLNSQKRRNHVHNSTFLGDLPTIKW